MNYDYTWEDIVDSVLNIPNLQDEFRHQGEFKRLSVTMYANHVPSMGDRILIQGIVFSCVYHTDVTTMQEAEEGLSYSQVYFESCEA